MGYKKSYSSDGGFAFGYLPHPQNLPTLIPLISRAGDPVLYHPDRKGGMGSCHAGYKLDKDGAIRKSSTFLRIARRSVVPLKPLRWRSIFLGRPARRFDRRCEREAARASDRGMRPQEGLAGFDSLAGVGSFPFF